MNPTDELVNAWVKKKFLESIPYLNNTALYGPAKGITVASADVESYCGCYSEYTRDDGFEMKAVLTGRFGEVHFTFSLWGNLPDFIEELDAFKYAGSDCPYDEEEYD